jgi:integrase
VATLQLRNDSYRVLFCYLGKRHTLTLGKVSEEEAQTKSSQIDYLLLRIKQQLLAVPVGVPIEEFMLKDGQVKAPEEAVAAPEPITFARFREKYLETHSNGTMEANSLITVKMHLKHVEPTLGERFPLQQLTLADLQRHITTRGKKKYRGKPLSPITLKKEIASFRAAWNWAALTGLVKGSFPSKGLVYPKVDEKPPFMTMAEIERRVTNSMPEAERAMLWDCLYLTQAELPKLLEHVKANAAYPWIYPMVCLAAHTGARRSEILRVLVQDVDFEAMTVLIREKKRSRKQRTTRRVPLTPLLATVLKEWLAQHPGGSALFCHSGEVFRSKKRGRTTGHQSGKARPTTNKERRAAVRKRELPPPGAITKDEAHDHLKRTLAGSKWEVVPGWHCLRHSFISACASKGVDQRLIDEWTGHSTEEQRKRYRHLYPTVQREAIAGVFGA